MASFFHDESRLNEFARRAQERSDREHKALLGPEGCEVDVLEWPASKCGFSLSPQQHSFKSVFISAFLENFRKGTWLKEGGKKPKQFIFL